MRYSSLPKMTAPRRFQMTRRSIILVGA